MIYLKTKPKGIDIQVQGLQQILYSELKKVWPVDDSSFDCHGRAYRNQTGNGYVPEVFNGGADTNANEYTEVLFNDSLKGLSFFGVGETQTFSGGAAKAKAYIIFMVDVNKLKPNIQHRADEEIHVDAEMVLDRNRYGFIYTGLDTGIEKVFREYPGYRVSDAMKYADMHPRHCFRLNFDLAYNIYDC